MIHGKTEAWLKDQGFQIVLIGHLHGLVGGIHQLDSQLHGLAVAYRAQRQGRGIDLLRLHTGRGKEGVFGDLGEEGEVGHINHSFQFLVSVISVTKLGNCSETSWLNMLVFSQ